MTNNDYGGRQVDLELLQTILTPSGITRVRIDNISGGVARMTTGIQKAVQRYAHLLLTGIKDVRFFDDRGGPLIGTLAAGTVSNTGYLIHLFVVSSISALDEITKDNDRPDLYGHVPSDERIVDVRLDNVSIDPRSASATFMVKIITAAGDSFDYIIPAAI